MKHKVRIGKSGVDRRCFYLDIYSRHTRLWNLIVDFERVSYTESLTPIPRPLRVIQPPRGFGSIIYGVKLVLSCSSMHFRYKTHVAPGDNISQVSVLLAFQITGIIFVTVTVASAFVLEWVPAASSAPHQNTGQRRRTRSRLIFGHRTPLDITATRELSKMRSFSPSDPPIGGFLIWQSPWATLNV